MSDEIATTSDIEANVPAVAAGDLIPNFAPQGAAADVLNTLSSTANWFNRVQLFGSQAGAVQEGKMNVGHFGYVADKETIVPLGNTFDVLIISWRPLAMATQDDPIQSTHDRESELFKSIEYRADNEQNSGCIYGPEFLLWVPSIGKFATFMLGSKSFRREAKVFAGFLRKAATIKSKLVSTDRFKWHVPVATPCSTPFDMPDMEVLAKMADTFNNPPPPVVKEKADNPAPGRAV